MNKSEHFSHSGLLTDSDEHLLYEIDMLLWTAMVLADPSRKITADSQDFGHMKFAILESFAIHLRNMIAFLYDDDPRPDHVVAADFMAPGEWARLRPAMSPTIKAGVGHAHRQIAHLTRKRFPADHPDRQWPFFALTREVMQIMQLFCTHASPERLSPRLRLLLAYLKVGGSLSRTIAE